MQPYDNLFNQTTFPPPEHSDQDRETCSPWSNQLAKSPFLRNQQPKTISHPPTRRYSSQFQSQHRVNKQKSGSPGYNQEKGSTVRKRHSILTEKSVTISYQSSRNEASSAKPQSNGTAIRFPPLSGKQPAALLSNKKMIWGVGEEMWQCLCQNQSRSLKKYNQRSLGERSQHFQMYKRSLIAARRCILNTLADTQSIPQQHSSLA